MWYAFISPRQTLSKASGNFLKLSQSIDFQVWTGIAGIYRTAFPWNMITIYG
jgi:hypothetical protein